MLRTITCWRAGFRRWSTLHLIDVARGSRAMRLMGASAIAMARPSHLEGRLLAVVDETRNRIVPRSITRRAVWASMTALMLPLAAATGRSASDPVSFVPRDTTLEQRYPARPGEKLTLQLETGGAVHITGWDEPMVQIRAALSGPGLRETTLEIAHRSPGIRLVTQQGSRTGISSTSHRFEFMVPRRYDVHIESAGGGVTIIGVEGTFIGQTGGGGVTLERLRGRATLGTGGGDINVSDSELDGIVSTGSGTVRLDKVSGDLRGSSGSGPVIRSPDKVSGKAETRSDDAELRERVVVGDRLARARGATHIQRAGGRIDLDRAPNGADVYTAGGDIWIANADKLVVAKTGGGDITLGVVNGSVEASTGAGTLRATVVDPGASVEFTTGKGNAIVTLPRGFDGRFELETAYTQNNPRTRIESDWELSESETDEWDSSQGSPRKYVRARGRAGNGPGLIRIEVVNGDITIRRSR